MTASGIQFIALIRWGCAHEKEARDAYHTMMIKKHDDFNLVISVVPINWITIGNSRLLGNFVTIGIGKF